MLNKDRLLSYTRDGLDVFRHYLPVEWRVGRNFKNPLYEDTNASCNVYFDRRSGMYRLKDFGNPDYFGDCFSIVAKLKNLDCTKDFAKIIQQINEEMGLGLEKGNIPANTSYNYDVKPEPPKDHPEKNVGEIKNVKPLKEIQELWTKTTSHIPPYTLLERGFTLKELSFWKQYGITLDILKLYKVISLSEFSGENKDGKAFTIYSSPQEPMFGYFGKKFVKMYRPFSKLRFLYGGRLPESYCFGLEQLPAKGSTLFITGGLSF